MRTYRLRLTPVLLFALATLLAAAPALAQRDNSKARPSPNAALSQTVGTTVIDLHYSRPGVKGRTIFGGLVPYGSVWRAGANEPTTLTVSGDVTVEGQALAAGTYNLFILPNEEGPWAVIFATPVRWGTMYDADNEVLRVSATAQEGPVQEWLSYTFEDLSDTSATLVMRWDTVVLPVQVAVAGM